MDLIKRLKQKPEGKYFLLSTLFFAAAIVCVLVGVSLTGLILNLNQGISPFVSLGTTIIGAIITVILYGWLVDKSAWYKAKEFVTSICRQVIEEGREAYWDPKYPRPVRKERPTEREIDEN